MLTDGEVVLTQGAGGVWAFYPGRRLPPKDSPERKQGHCPRCGHGPVPVKETRYASSETGYFFECPTCVDPDRARRPGHRWKEPRG